MCGIAGILAFGDDRVDLAAAALPMAQQMQRRGPDDEGFLFATWDAQPVVACVGDQSAPDPDRQRVHVERAAPAHIALVHRRLSIIDRSAAGHQPMCSPDGRYWLVYNGEIYNFRELASELRAQGVEFSSNSDSEVLLQAYVRWGVDALRRLNGMFAFAIWDDREKRLFLARDRIGIKPLYYVSTPRHFLFASDIKTLIASGHYQPTVDLEGLYHNLSFGIAPRPMTCFEGVRALRQAHTMTVARAGKPVEQRYWQIPTGQQDFGMSEARAVEEVEHVLERAVQRRLLADVPVGCFMSGGIDSTTVSAIAAKHHPGIKCFTLGFALDVAERDEVDVARKTARMYELDHVVRVVGASDLLDHLDSVVECYEEPAAGMSPNFQIARLAADNGVTVVLNGLGGDELFAGYSYYRHIRYWRWLHSLGFLARHARLPEGKASRLRDALTATTADRYHSARRSGQTETAKRRLFPKSHWPASADFVHDLYTRDVDLSDATEAVSFMDLVNYVGNHHVHRVDQFTMRFSLEARLPLLDHELVELAFRIPTKLKLRRGIRKYVLRRVARRWIDPASLEMRKKGFGLPIAKWLRGPLRELADEKLEKLCARGLLDADEIRDRWSRFGAHALPASYVWPLVLVELWQERFFDAHS